MKTLPLFAFMVSAFPSLCMNRGYLVIYIHNMCVCVCLSIYLSIYLYIYIMNPNETKRLSHLDQTSHNDDNDEDGIDDLLGD